MRRVRLRMRYGEATKTRQWCGVINIDEAYLGHFINLRSNCKAFHIKYTLLVGFKQLFETKPKQQPQL